MTDQPQPDLVTRVATAITAEAMKPRAERVGLVHVMIAVVQPDLDARDAEIAWLRQHVHELQSKVMSSNNGQCCCSFDGPGDVCMVHSPTVDSLRVELEQARQRTETLAGIVALHLHTGWHLPKRTAEEKTRAKWAAGEANALAAALHAAEINVFADHNPAGVSGA